MPTTERHIIKKLNKNKALGKNAKKKVLQKGKINHNIALGLLNSVLSFPQLPSHKSFTLKSLFPLSLLFPPITVGPLFVVLLVHMHV